MLLPYLHMLLTRKYYLLSLKWSWFIYCFQCSIFFFVPSFFASLNGERVIIFIMFNVLRIQPCIQEPGLHPKAKTVKLIVFQKTGPLIFQSEETANSSCSQSCQILSLAQTNSTYMSYLLWHATRILVAVVFVTWMLVNVDTGLLFGIVFIVHF